MSVVDVSRLLGGGDYMTREEFRKHLVELVKASGQEVVDRAEEG